MKIFFPFKELKGVWIALKFMMNLPSFQIFFDFQSIASIVWTQYQWWIFSFLLQRRARHHPMLMMISSRWTFNDNNNNPLPKVENRFAQKSYYRILLHKQAAKNLQTEFQKWDPSFDKSPYKNIHKKRVLLKTNSSPTMLILWYKWWWQKTNGQQKTKQKTLDRTVTKDLFNILQISLFFISCWLWRLLLNYCYTKIHQNRKREKKMALMTGLR